MARAIPNKDAAVLENSDDPRELVDMARIFAASEDPADHGVLLQHLGSGQFLSRLNTEEEYMELQPRGLNVARAIKTLMDQGHPAAVNTLVGLTQADAFQSYYPLIELNIAALAADRPASPITIAYWDQHSSAKSTTIDLVIEAIFANRSEPALRLFEQKMNDPAQDEMRKSSWLRDALLRRRNDVEVLRFCGSAMFSNTLNANWHNPLLEALFDYNDAWYIACEYPTPPSRLEASPAAKDLMYRVGRQALTQTEILIPGLSAKIKIALKEIGYDWDEDDPA